MPDKRIKRRAVKHNRRLLIRPNVGHIGFADVAATAYYADAVTWLATSGISTGTTPTTFSPDQQLTRAQAATLLWRAAGSPDVA